MHTEASEVLPLMCPKRVRGSGSVCRCVPGVKMRTKSDLELAAAKSRQVVAGSSWVDN